MDTFDEALSRAPDLPSACVNKGRALTSRGDLLSLQSRHDEAEQAYADAVSAYDEVLSRAPDDVMALFNMALTLLYWGAALRSFVQDEVTRGRWEAARAHAERVLVETPRQEQAMQLLAFIRQQLDTLEVDSPQEE